MPSRVRDYYLALQKGEIILTNKTNINTVFVQVIERPTRKLILNRGIKATHYFEYCNKVGCDIWGTLCSIKEALYEPIGMWLPEKFVKPGTSVYAQGVEVPIDFAGDVPEGFDIIDLPPCKMMVFQGPPYDDCKFQEAIANLWEVMKNYNLELEDQKNESWLLTNSV
jgi:AraC family transcriptional regulator